MPTLPNMGLITPTLGGDSGEWDDKINACFAKVDAHDHTPGKGLQVPVAGLDINADLPMGGHAIDNVAALGFVAVDPAAGATRLYVSSVDNELYWQAADGTSVKLTSGSGIDVSLVGGIGGDYAAVGAQITYSDADVAYTLQDGQVPRRWARLATGPVRIHEFNTTETVHIELLAPAALAASYSVTWPAAPPSGKLAMQMAADGTISLSNAFASDVTVAGAVTATGVVQGTDVRYTSEQTIEVPVFLAEDPTPAHAKYRSPDGAHVGWELGNNVNPIFYYIPGLRVSDTITGFALRLHKDSPNTSIITATLYRYRAADESESSVVSATNNENAPGITSIVSSSVAHKVGTFGDQYYVKVASLGSVDSERLGVLEIKVKRTA